MKDTKNFVMTQLRAIFCMALTVTVSSFMPSEASATSQQTITAYYMQVSGTSYSMNIGWSLNYQTLPNVVMHEISPGTGWRRARMTVNLNGQYGAESIGLLINTVGNDAKRCSIANPTELASPRRLSFDVYCVLPLGGTQWTYTMSDFQILVHTASTESRTTFAIVNADGTLPSSWTFRNFGNGLPTVSRNSQGYYQVELSSPSNAVPNVQVQALGSQGTICELQSQREYYSTPQKTVRFFVACFNTAGSSADTQFRFEANFATVAGPGGGYVTSLDPVTGGVGTPLFAEGPGPVAAASITQWGGVGRWLLTRSYNTTLEARILSFVTAVRRPNEPEDNPYANYCKVGARYPDLTEYWVWIRCFHFDGTPVSTTFNEMSTYRL